MTIQEAANALQELANDVSYMSKMAQLRLLWADIERAKRAGISNRKIADVLQDKGVSISLKTFETLLSRIRKENKAASLNSPPSVGQIPMVNAPSAVPTAAAPGESAPSGHPPELEAQLVGLTTKQRREKIGEYYIKEPPNPLLKQLLEK